MPGVLDKQTGYVFVHVPKCAGTSVSHRLLQRGQAADFKSIPGLEDIIQRDNAGPGDKIGHVGHGRARQIREVLGDQDFEALDSFAVVRNPWDRLVSRYNFLRSSMRGTLPDYLRGSFSEFVLWACKNRKSTQVDRLADEQGIILVKDLLKFENLQTEFQAYSMRLFGTALDLPMLNRTAATVQKATFSGEAREAVRAAYAEDFAAFGYSDRGPPDKHA